jgi:hypothetical protein
MYGDAEIIDVNLNVLLIAPVGKQMEQNVEWNRNELHLKHYRVGLMADRACEMVHHITHFNIPSFWRKIGTCRS